MSRRREKNKKQKIKKRQENFSPNESRLIYIILYVLLLLSVLRQSHVECISRIGKFSIIILIQSFAYLLEMKI
mgnify:CR=1 FL=1